MGVWRRVGHCLGGQSDGERWGGGVGVLAGLAAIQVEGMEKAMGKRRGRGAIRTSGQ